MSRPLDPGDLVGMHGLFSSDRDVFADSETFVVQAKADLIVAVAFRIVEIPLPARLAPQQSYAVFAPVAELSDAAKRLVRLPVGSIKPTFSIEWDKQIVSDLSIPDGMSLFAGQKQPHVPKARCQICQRGHSAILYLP
ncbi:hypothetical protein GJR93_01695 [Aminobacter sp. MDW-2]|nr:hypothetical protein [Aminobacter sp. MDW-2]